MYHEGSEEPRNGDCRGVHFLKYLLFIFNFVFMVGGVAILAVASWTVAEKHTYTPVLATSTYAATGYLLLLAGLLALPAALLACCAIHKENKFYLLMYTFLLLAVILLEAAAGVVAYVYEEQVMAELRHTLEDRFTLLYGVDEKVTQAVDAMQIEFQCCGAKSYSEWSDSEWRVSGLAENNTVPDSCCKTPSSGCGIRDHPSNVWYNGCIHALEEELTRHLLLLGAVGCGLAVLEVLGVVLACCLYLKLRKQDDYDRGHSVPYKQCDHGY